MRLHFMCLLAFFSIFFGIYDCSMMNGRLKVRSNDEIMKILIEFNNDKYFIKIVCKISLIFEVKVTY